MNLDDLAFAAAQAAQKWVRRGKATWSAFAAAQAAQKQDVADIEDGDAFAAAQAAQKNSHVRAS